MMKITDQNLIKILNTLIKHKAIPILVGGCVRDSFLDIVVKDYDIEVYGLDTLEELEKILKNFGSVNLVGKNFGILKLTTATMEYDFSFPRLENKTAQGHKGFDVQINGSLKFTEAAKRRDFTINAIGYDYHKKVYLDPFDGIKDIGKNLLKHIDDDTFIEDPLRVYRAIQFSARFNFRLDIKTFQLCMNIIQQEEFRMLSKERILEEYKKLFLKSQKPSLGLVLLNTFKIQEFSPLMMSRIDLIVCKNTDDKTKLFFIFLLLEKLCSELIDDKKLLKNIQSFKNFRVPFCFKDKIKKSDPFIEQLFLKNQIKNSMPKPLFMGKDLVKMGYKPNKKFKSILDILYKMQLSGKIC